MKISLILFILALSFSGCIERKIQQGNVFKKDNVWLIQEGDTRFAIESELGPPAIIDEQHPERAVFVEYFHDTNTDKKYTRSVEVIYDKSWHAISIHRFGFE